MRALLLCGLVLSGCATTKEAAKVEPEPAKTEAPPPAVAEKPKPSPEELAKQLEQMFAREREPAGDVSMTLDGKTIQLEASSPVEITRSEELRQTGLAFGIGTAEKVQCFVYDQMVPVGALLGRLTEGLRGKVDVRTVRTSAIEVVEKEPAVFTDIGYVASTPKGNVIGQIKLGIYPNPTAPLACLHDEPGYVDTFKRVVTRLASGLAKARPAADASYRTVYVVSIRGAPVGFERSVYTKAKDGTRTATTVSAMIVPRSASEWMLHDSAYVAQIGKDGYVTEKAARILANGDEQLDVKLKRDKAGYAYSGRVSQKELSGTFKTKDKKGIPSDVIVTKAVKTQLMTGKKVEVQFEQYMPDADPSQALTVITRRDALAGPDAVVVETAKLKMMGHVDANGDISSLEVPMGPVTLMQERKFVEGSPE